MNLVNSVMRPSQGTIRSGYSSIACLHDAPSLTGHEIRRLHDTTYAGPQIILELKLDTNTSKSKSLANISLISLIMGIGLPMQSWLPSTVIRRYPDGIRKLLECVMVCQVRISVKNGMWYTRALHFVDCCVFGLGITSVHLHVNACTYMVFVAAMLQQLISKLTSKVFNYL